MICQTCGEEIEDSASWSLDGKPYCDRCAAKWLSKKRVGVER